MTEPPTKKRRMPHPPSLLNSGSSDVIINAKGKTKRWYAHKSILSNACGFFRGLFDGNFREKHSNSIELDIEDLESFEAMLRFFYHESISDALAKAPYELFLVADKYLVPRLYDRVLRQLESKVPGYPDSQFAEFSNKVFSDQVYKEINGPVKDILLQDIKKRDILGLIGGFGLNYTNTECAELPITILKILLEGEMDVQNLQRVNCSNPQCRSRDEAGYARHWSVAGARDFDIEAFYCVYCRARRQTVVNVSRTKPKEE